MSLFSRLSKVFKGQTSGKTLTHPKTVHKVQPKAPKWPELTSRPITPVQPPAPSQTAVKVQTDTIVREAQARAREIILEAKDQALKIREESEKKARTQDQEFRTQQSAFERQEHEIVRKEAALNEKEKFLNKLEEDHTKKAEETESLKKRLVEKLEEISALTRDEARTQLFQAVEKKSAKEIALKIKAAEEKAREEADDKAQEILIDAMKHGATDYVAEYAVSTVELPSEDIKGRLIGKEGRNIRAFERATGVDLDLDEQPGVVRLSSFDSVRREIARQALKRLIADGRIQPTRIEEYVVRSKTDIEKVMFEEGKKLCMAVGAFNVPHEIIAFLGRFKYRSSYGQNMIAHTLEETKIGIALAAETGANVDTVRLGCLFHDIGKVITDEEGSHVELGVKLLKKNSMPQAVIDCVAQHHEDTAFTSKESILVYIADAISGARPGARFENYDEYVKRLTTMEAIAKENAGVSEAYAIQAGRELRVIVDYKAVNDEEIVILADKIRDRIKNEMTYPGTVTVNVIRELRASAVAA